MLIWPDLHIYAINELREKYYQGPNHITYEAPNLELGK
jgi:hypothetical protein